MSVTGWCNSPVITSHMGLSNIHFCHFLLSHPEPIPSFCLSVHPSLPDPAVSPLSLHHSDSPTLFVSLIFVSDSTSIGSVGP